MTEIAFIAQFAAALIVSITIHEAAHAFAAHWQGDRTPAMMGRTTLNPLSHISPMGTLLPIAMVAAQIPLLFGWGKPVLVRHSEMRYPRLSPFLVAFAGPISNLVMVFVSGALLAVAYSDFAQLMVELNIILFAFNLLPIPPLDGGVALMQVLPKPAREFVEDYILPYGFWLIAALLISGGLGHFLNFVRGIAGWVLAFILEN